MNSPIMEVAAVSVSLTAPPSCPTHRHKAFLWRSSCTVLRKGSPCFTRVMFLKELHKRNFAKFQEARISCCNYNEKQVMSWNFVKNTNGFTISCFLCHTDCCWAWHGFLHVITSWVDKTWEFCSAWYNAWWSLTCRHYHMTFTKHWRFDSHHCNQID